MCSAMLCNELIQLIVSMCIDSASREVTTRCSAIPREFMLMHSKYSAMGVDRSQGGQYIVMNFVKVCCTLCAVQVGRGRAV